jgi:hypothetical protein
MLKKNFEGRWMANTTVHFTSAETRETIEEFQIVELEIKKIADQSYLCIFTQIYPSTTSSVIKNNQFVCVATQTTDNKYLLQSGTSGLNNFYFKTDSEKKHIDTCCEEDVLYTTFNDSVRNNRVVIGWISGAQKYTRI